MAKVLSIDEAADVIINYINKSYLIVCVGTYLRRDDYLALYLCRKLNELGIKVIECEYGIENCLDVITELRPKGILIIDAVLADVPAGTIVLSKEEDIRDGVLATTHNVPIKLIIKYLREVYGISDVTVLGIRALDLSFGEGLSKIIKKTIDELINKLSKRIEST